MLKRKSIISTEDYSKKDLEELFVLANDIRENPTKYNAKLKGYILGVLFFEPSTRTRLSFEAAMLKLGGNVSGFSDAMSSSVSKGESIKDTVKTVASFADIIVMRHPKEGSAKIASDAIDIPLINAGDGTHYHPTQTLTDLYTIYRNKNSIDNLVVGLCGDLKFGRTVHSLIKKLSEYKNIKFILIAPDKLKIPNYIKDKLGKDKIEYRETSCLDDEIKNLDVLYMTRVQKERFFNEEEYIKLKDNFILNKKTLTKAKKDLIIMHPLPRNNEIHPEVDTDKRAVYFNQVKCGLYIRMALLLKIMGG